jgi:hypothetical protein
VASGTVYAICERPKGWPKLSWTRGPLLHSIVQAHQYVERLEAAYAFQEFVKVLGLTRSGGEVC